MKKLSIYKKIFALLICLSLVLSMSLSAFAGEAGEGVIDPSALQKLVDDFVAERGIEPKNFSVGYVYTAT